MPLNEDLNSIKSNPAVLRIYGNRMKLEKRGLSYFGLCPFHAEKSPSFSVVQSKEGSWLYKCFGCDQSGDVVTFVQKTENLSFVKALEFIKQVIGYADSMTNKHVEEVFKSVDSNREYKTFTLEEYGKLEKALAANRAAQEWLANERGITGGVAKKLHIGYRQSLPKSKATDPKIVDVLDKGWISFPYIEGGKVVSLKYRSIAKKSFSRQPGMRTALFNIETVDFLEPVFLCEGEPDCCIMEMAGFRAVALPNAVYRLTPQDRDALLQAESIILSGDNDGGAGIKAMDRLKADFGDRAIKISWPDGYKDANEVYLKYAKKDLDKFRELVYSLIKQAKSQPLPGVYSLVEIMGSAKDETLVDHPDRFRFPWKSVDEMAILMPGSVAFSTATSTGMGKSTFWLGATLHAARKHKEVILSYQVELSPQEVANIVAAHVLSKDRNSLAKEDYNKAATLLKGVRYYIGADTSLTDSKSVLDLIEAAVKRLGATVVVLDHIHFITRSLDNDIQEQATAMQRIKNMARTYGLKFIVIGQPRKAEQKNKGKSLHISDVKGSEANVADSDAVYFIHREVVKDIDPDNPPMDEYEPETEIHLKKVRSRGRGPAFAKLYFHGASSTFLELSPVEEGAEK